MKHLIIHFLIATITISNSFLQLSLRAKLNNKRIFTTSLMNYQNDESDIEEPTSVEEYFSECAVKYFDGDSGSSEYEELSNKHLLIPTESTDNEILTLALMPFESPLFIGAKEFLFLYEMRFRALMNDIQKDGNLVGRYFISEEGRIGSIGSLCKAIETLRTEDGKGYLIIEATARFKIKKIIRQTPYVFAEVEVLPGDKMIPGEESAYASLSRDLFSSLKTYMRILRLHPQDSDDMKRRVSLSKHILNSLPACISLDKVGSNEEDTLEIFEQFSLACANLIATDPIVMQLLFQSSSTKFRLEGLKLIAEEAVQELIEILLEEGWLDEDLLESVCEQSSSADDDISDILPPEDYEGMSLKTSLDPKIFEELTKDRENWVYSCASDSESEKPLLQPKKKVEARGGDTTLKQTDVTFEDIWDGRIDILQ